DGERLRRAGAPDQSRDRRCLPALTRAEGRAGREGERGDHGERQRCPPAGAVDNPMRVHYRVPPPSSRERLGVGRVLRRSAPTPSSSLEPLSGIGRGYAPTPGKSRAPACLSTATPLTLTPNAGKGLYMEAVPKPPARIADVAARAKVGIATVSRVVNDRGNVAPATRERVLEAIRALEYRPSSVAQNLSLKRTLVIGVVLPFL